jgi:hypothetical protein
MTGAVSLRFSRFSRFGITFGEKIYPNLVPGIEVGSHGCKIMNKY